ncbi:hypothetical protein [[Phormidium] sp. ETS-05]|uniref:hypothetical protein n=1 Tax=[Phormidium] sp. ETS-05 TaxID=222819 RepID=UPI0018EED4E9|nr:hypothetical protein [[Phormidium] sp. ETS-05]
MNSCHRGEKSPRQKNRTSGGLIHIATDFSPWRRRWRSELGRSERRPLTPQVKTCGYMNQTP